MAFRCGVEALDEYLKRFASQDIKRGLARVFVASPEESPERIAGFFSLSAGSVRADDLPESVRRRLPRYPVPVALLGRLAVDADYQGKGLGSILLVDACRKVESAEKALAVTGIIVEAKGASATRFYQHFGFIELPGHPGRLLLPRKAFPIID